MGVIYLQDFEPWAAVGELAGQYASHRLGALQNNKMAKGYQSMLNGDAQQGQGQLQVIDNQNRNTIQMQPTQFNSAQYVNDAMRNNSVGAQMVAQNNGLWGQPTQPGQVAQTPQPAAPVQANTDAPAVATQPQQSTGLWNFQNLNNTGIGVPQTYQDMVQQRGTNFFHQAPNLVSDGNTEKDKAQGQYTIPDKANLTNEARKRLGANTLALVKAGFDFKTAQGLASEQYQNDINSMYAQQVNEYQEKVLEPMRQKIMNNLVFTQDKDGNQIVDTYNSKRVKGLAPAVARYNYLAGKLGVQGIDMNNLNSIASLDKPDYKFSSAQNGHVIRYNMGEGTMEDMGNYGKVDTKQFANGDVIVMTPDGQMKNIGNFGAKNIKVMPDGKTYIVGTNGSMQYVGTHVKPQGTTVTGTSGYNAQVLRTLSAQHTQWVKANPDKSESESPYYSQLQSALGSVPNTGTPTVKREPTYSSEEQSAIAKRMNELSAQGWSDDQIAAELDASGYGGYKKWLKTY